MACKFIRLLARAANAFPESELAGRVAALFDRQFTVSSVDIFFIFVRSSF